MKTRVIDMLNNAYGPHKKWATLVIKGATNDSEERVFPRDNIPKKLLFKKAIYSRFIPNGPENRCSYVCILLRRRTNIKFWKTI